MQIGPLHAVLALLAADEDSIAAVCRELEQVRGHGAVRLLDMLVVRKDELGTLEVVSQKAATRNFAEYGVALRRLAGLGASQNAGLPAREASCDDSAFGVSCADIRAVMRGIPPGTAVALALYEHRWAGSLAAAIRRAGGNLLAHGALAGDAAMAVSPEVHAIAEGLPQY